MRPKPKTVASMLLSTGYSFFWYGLFPTFLLAVSLVQWLLFAVHFFIEYVHFDFFRANYED